MRDLQIIQMIIRNDKSSLYSMNNNVKLVTFRIGMIKPRNFDYTYYFNVDEFL